MEIGQPLRRHVVACGGAADGAGAGAGAVDAATGATARAQTDLTAAYQAAGRALSNSGLGAWAYQHGLIHGQAVRALGFWTIRPSAMHIFAEAPPPKLEDAGITVGELVGWRWWRVQHLRLASVVLPWGWLPGKTAVARVFDGSFLPEASASKVWDGEPTGGIYALKDRQEALLANDVPELLMAFGSVSLWGTVIEHERGYRAQYAKVRSLDWIGVGRRATPDVLAVLRRVYGVGGEA